MLVFLPSSQQGTSLYVHVLTIVIMETPVMKVKETPPSHIDREKKR